jgi:hypothetical protein
MTDLSAAINLLPQIETQAPPRKQPIMRRYTGHPKETAILEILAAFGYLTISQIADMLYSLKLDGTLPKQRAVRPRPGKPDEYLLQRNYEAARDMLARMVKRGLILHLIGAGNDHHLFCLPSADDRSTQSFVHEREVGQIGVVMYKAGLVSSWMYRWPIGFLDTVPKGARIKPDGHQLTPTAKQWIRWEHDRGYETPKDIEDKIKMYEAITPLCEPFVGIFTFIHQPGRANLKRRMEMFLRVTAKYGQGKKYMCASYLDIIADPKGENLIWYNATKKLSVADIR